MKHAVLIRKAIELCGSQPRLAQRVGCRQQTISKLLQGEIQLSVEMALAIHRATAGKVSAGDLRPDWPWPERIPLE